MYLAVFGANGPTGLQVVRQALAAGHHVKASTRKPDTRPISSPRLHVVASDVTDPNGVARAPSSEQTRTVLGWKPTQPRVIADIDRPGYYEA